VILLVINLRVACKGEILALPVEPHNYIRYSVVLPPLMKRASVAATT